MKRALCCLIGHHRWPAQEYFDRASYRCLRCGARPSKWPWRLRKWMPLDLERGRWFVRLRLGWHWLVSVALELRLRRYGDWAPAVDVDLNLWRLHLDAWIGGLGFVDEDCERRTLAGVSATFTTYGLVDHVCRVRGHKVWESPTGDGYCDRCGHSVERREPKAAAA